MGIPWPRVLGLRECVAGVALLGAEDDERGLGAVGGPFDQADFVGSEAVIFCLETVEDLFILSIN